MGVTDLEKQKEKEHNDSFEKYYNKDLDLDEGKSAVSETVLCVMEC